MLLSSLFSLWLVWVASVSASSELPARARVESCGGCKLNRLSEVRAFVYEDFEKNYENTHFKRIPGKSPELIFIDADDKEIERINIEHMNRVELNDLMRKNGFKHRKEDKEKVDTDNVMDKEPKEESVESQGARPPTDEL